MTFIIQGLNGHELMSVDQIFKDPAVKMVEPTIRTNSLDESKNPQLVDSNNIHNKVRQSATKERRAADAYQATEKLPRNDAILHAEQIMT